MPFLHSPAVLRNWPAGHGNSTESQEIHSSKQRSPNLRSTHSIARLIDLVRNPIENVGELVENWYEGSTRDERAKQQNRDEARQIWYLRLGEATSYEDWKAAATKLDDIEGNNQWKSVFESPDYDAALVEARLQQLDEARIRCDVGRMLFLVRTSLTRGLGEMGNLRLYKHTHIGTKDLIDTYIDSALLTLDQLLDVSARACDGPETKYILEQVLSARQAFGRSALLLSGGANFGMSHIGVLKSLWESHLLPRIVSGASAGSIVCAVFCTRTAEEIPDLLRTFRCGDLAVFEEKGNEDGLLRKVARFLKFGALFDISHLIRVMRDILGEITFQEAYNRSRMILNICVSSASLYELPRLLNYITAPNVLIWSAVAASCSVPLIFSAASILAKDPKTGEAVPWNPSPQRWIDGSVDGDLPMTRLAELFNVNHFIVSQVNPHVVPFLGKEEDSMTQEAHQSTATVTAAPTWVHAITHLAKGEALHRMHTLAEMGIFPNTLTKAVSVLSQKYSGDINIFPEISYADFPRMLSNPTPEFMLQAQLCGERATWPKLSRIRNHCAIELALDEAVHRLRARVAFSPSQVDLRLISQTRSNSDMRKGGRRHPRRRERPLSQKSAPEIDITPLRFPPNRPQSWESDPRLTGGEDSRPSTSKLPTIHTAPGTAPRAWHELTSSGAETCNLNSSSTSSSLSSLSAAGGSFSPTCSNFDKYHHHDLLFPSVSQPATPSCFSTGFPPAPKTPPHDHPLLTSSNLLMTPKQQHHLPPPPHPPPHPPSTTKPAKPPADPNSAESRYKRIFHPRSSTATPPSPSSYPPSSSARTLGEQRSRNSVSINKPEGGKSDNGTKPEGGRNSSSSSIITKADGERGKNNSRAAKKDDGPPKRNWTQGLGIDLSSVSSGSGGGSGGSGGSEKSRGRLWRKKKSTTTQ